MATTEAMTTLGVKVPKDFSKAVAWFAERENQTTAAYLKRGAARLSSLLFKNQQDFWENHVKIADIMQRAVDDGRWEQMAKDSSDIYPATLEGWKAQIAKHLSEAEKAKAELLEMRDRLTDLDVEMIE